MTRHKIITFRLKEFFRGILFKKANLRVVWDDNKMVRVDIEILRKFNN